MKVWLVRHYEYERADVLAVCTSLEIAKQIMAQQKEPCPGASYAIEEYETDQDTGCVYVDGRDGKRLWE